MPIQGCCPPLALPRTQLGAEIIGFEPKTGQFVQAAAGAPPARVVDYPYYASAGFGRAPAAGLGTVTSTALWGVLALLLVASVVVTVKDMREVYR